MKILSLNTWHGGKLKEEITAFIARQANDIDVFCFQETEEGFDDVVAVLRSGYKEIQSEKATKERGRYLRMYVRNNFSILQKGEVLNDSPNGSFGLWAIVDAASGPVWVCSVHGVSYPGDKFDTPERIEASLAFIEAAEMYNGPKILMGDFNLEMETESVGLFEKNGFRNLIKDFNISTTRNQISFDMYPNSKQRYADYTFVKGATVKYFEVSPDIVSDHQAMILEI